MTYHKVDIDYHAHFKREHIPQVEREISCLVDLCERLALNTREVDLERAERDLEDLKKSFQAIVDLNAVKRSGENES